MSELVGEQFAPRAGLGRVFARAENDVAPGREGAGLQRPCRRRRIRAGVDTNVGEIRAKPPLEESADPT